MGFAESMYTVYQLYPTTNFKINVEKAGTTLGCMQTASTPSAIKAPVQEVSPVPAGVSSELPS